jgi:aspartyl protease family protein
MSKNTLTIGIIWLALAALIVYLVDNIQNPNKINRLGENSTVVLKRGLDGHYRAEALINGEKVNVLVDTGATGVAISQSIADRLNLKSMDAIRTNTANGDSIGYMVRLKSLQLGGVNANDVSAMIAPGLDGHYRAEALINGEKVNVLVDTGATGVAISQSIADRLNLKSMDAIRTNTANGDSIGYMVRLKSLQLGGVNANDVSAMIALGLDGDVLLGMSFLGRMDVRLFNGEMTIKQVEY